MTANDIACVILEAATSTAKPEPGYLQGVRRLCDRHGTLFILDEMITGFRWSSHGAQAVYDVRPDLSCWGKRWADGFPVSALAGKREYMELGGLRTDANGYASFPPRMVPRPARSPRPCGRKGVRNR